MAARGRCLEMEMSAASSLLSRVAPRSEKWIIQRTDEQSGQRDVGQKLTGTVPSPVVRRVAEAVDWCSEAVVKLLKRANAVEPGQVKQVRKHALFRPDLRPHRDKKAVHVDPVRGQ